MIEERMKNLEIEVAYLRKEIEELRELILLFEGDQHFHYTNVYYSKEYLDSLNQKKE